MANDHFDHQNHGLKQDQVAVVVVPFLAQGHLNQFLHLSRLISSYDIPVHYVTTTTHSRQAKLRVHGWDPLAIANIHFHEFPTPAFLSPPPNPNAPTKFPTHLQPSFDASSHLREPIGKLLSTLSSNSQRVVIIHDSLMANVVQDFVSIPNAEAYTYQTTSAFCVFWYLWESMGKSLPAEIEILEDLPRLDDCFTSEFLEFANTQLEYSSGTICNSSKIIEGHQYINLLAKEKKLWAMGPFNLVVISDNKNSNQRHKCLEWLDKQTPKSVIFVSFGTTTSLSDEQIQELAIGLEKSEIKFIWVLRDADKGDVFSGEVRRIMLPIGYEERVEGNGIVLREWAPQLEILGHPSTGGFLSHCGWNSCIESITMGVPILAWPMHSDQPWNTLLITKVLKIGMVLKDWACRNELVTSNMVQKGVMRLMASKEGDEIRERVVELGFAVRKSVEEGGGAGVELASFIAHITR